MKTYNDDDVSSFTDADLLQAIAKWKQDAEHIIHIADDLPTAAVNDVCAQLCGDAGPRFKRLIVEVFCVEPADSAAYDAAAIEFIDE